MSSNVNVSRQRNILAFCKKFFFLTSKLHVSWNISKTPEVSFVRGLNMFMNVIFPVRSLRSIRLQ